MSFPCPHCGGAIVVILRAQPPQSSDATAAIQAESKQVAQEILNQDLAVTKDGRQSYNRGYSREFLLFWGMYPRKRDKRKAQMAWRNALRRAGATPEEAAARINAGAIRYRDDPNREDGFTKYAEGWLNGDGWEDEPLPPRLDRRRDRPLDPPRPMTSGEMDQFIEHALGKERE